MIEIRQIQHCLWRNIYSPRPSMTAEIGLADVWSWTTAQLDAELAHLLKAVFGIGADAEPRDAAALIAETAQHLQSIGDPVEPHCGVHSREEQSRTATIFFACSDPYLGQAAVFAAARIVGELTRPGLGLDQLQKLIGQSVRLAEGRGFDQSTLAMVKKVQQRGIPWFRVMGETRLIQLGQGVRQRRLRETMTSAVSLFGRDLCRNKYLTFKVLDQVHLPVGRFAMVSDLPSALKLAEKIGYPVVLKPTEGGKGKGVFANLRNAEDLKIAFQAATRWEKVFLLQSHFPGDDHRILVVAGKVVAAARRNIAAVKGDGRHSIRDLAAIENRDARRGPGYTRLMNLIEIDKEVERVLAQQGLTAESVPPPSVRIRLRATANISSGGTADDMTATIHADNARVAIKAALALDAKIAGVDFISPDISRSWREAGGGICEVNMFPGLRPHVLANPMTDIVGPIIDTIYPGGEDGRIPTAIIAGTKGETATALMLRSILMAAGHVAGCATTRGATVGEDVILTGNLAGVSGAALVMRDPTVTAAVLETGDDATRQGMYLDRCDVVALLAGAETVDDAGAMQERVLEAATRAVVLNADDASCAAHVRYYRSRIRTILFSFAADSAVIREHIAAGGEAILSKSVQGRETIVWEGMNGTATLAAIADIPAIREGLAHSRIASAMAATGLALGLGIAADCITEELKRYEMSGAWS